MLALAASSLDSARAAAAALVEGPVLDLCLAGSGANSRIFRVETPAGPVALKSYPARSSDTRNRQDVEWRALELMRASGEALVPKPLARDAGGAYTVLEWIEGRPVTDPSDGDVAAACAFVERVFRLSRRLESASFPPASEACLSGSEILRQIAARLESFVPHGDLDRFLQGEFRPAWADARGRLPRNGLNGVLPPSKRRLIPADFGFHNALRLADGTLRFFDFEYFGWDDPAKLTADVMMHPAYTLTPAQRRAIRDRAVAVLADDPGFAERLDIALLYRLRWVLILLNVFRRDRAGDLVGDARDEVFARQLGKARGMLRGAV